MAVEKELRINGFVSASEVALSTLEWPPYTGANLPQKGAVSSVITNAFENLGYQTQIAFWPWNRTIKHAASGFRGLIGYFPGYHCRHDKKVKFIPSEPIADAPLGFAYRKEQPFRDWKTLDDLAPLRIGYVTGYASTPAFEMRERAGELKVFRTADDRHNILNLLNKNVDIALIDKFVFNFLLASDRSLAQYKGKLGFSTKPLDKKALYLCLRDNELGKKLILAFNHGLKQVNPEQIVADYFANAFSSVGLGAAGQ